jgi:hypothetical protein
MQTGMTSTHSGKEKKDGTGILDARIFYFFEVIEKGVSGLYRQ